MLRLDTSRSPETFVPDLLASLDGAARQEAEAALRGLAGGDSPEDFLIELLEVTPDESLGWAHRKLADCLEVDRPRLRADLRVLAALVRRAEACCEAEVMAAVRARHGESLAEGLGGLVGAVA